MKFSMCGVDVEIAEYRSMVWVVFSVRGDDMDKKEEYRQWLEAQLKEWKASIDRLEARTSLVSSERNTDLLREIEELRRKKMVVKEKLNELLKTGGEVWDTLKEGVEKAVAELKQALDKSISRFK